MATATITHLKVAFAKGHFEFHVDLPLQPKPSEIPVARLSEPREINKIIDLRQWGGQILLASVIFRGPSSYTACGPIGADDRRLAGAKWVKGGWANHGVDFSF
jgi:hypothetical protein